jgi:hypothetical protein
MADSHNDYLERAENYERLAEEAQDPVLAAAFRRLANNCRLTAERISELESPSASRPRSFRRCPGPGIQCPLVALSGGQTQRCVICQLLTQSGHCLVLQREIAGSQYVVVRQLDAEISPPIAVGVERDDGIGALSLCRSSAAV